MPYLPPPQPLYDPTLKDQISRHGTRYLEVHKELEIVKAIKPKGWGRRYTEQKQERRHKIAELEEEKNRLENEVWELTGCEISICALPDPARTPRHITHADEIVYKYTYVISKPGDRPD